MLSTDHPALDHLVFPPTITVRSTLVVSDGGLRFAVHHAYVEMLWVPIIGPSAGWMLRRLGGWAIACPHG
jgi:hypothetical protein